MSAEISIEAWTDRPAGGDRVFAAVFPHSDDLSIFVGGTVLKLLHEGYTGYFIKTTNDDKDSYDLSAAETIYRIDKETRAVADYAGLAKVYTFDYQNHYLEPGQLIELRHRLITLFRYLRVDTVLTFDPWGRYEENPDHTVTAQAVEAACWMASRNRDLPELADLGLRPQTVRRKYYVARGPQTVNHIVDVSPVADRKRAMVALHRTPIDNMWRTYHDIHPEAPLSRERFIDVHLIDDAGDDVGLDHVERFRFFGDPTALRTGLRRTRSVL